jgi:hypothetical protein
LPAGHKQCKALDSSGSPIPGVHCT